MRTLLLFRGAPGCGKSTFIKEHGLEPYTLCADTFRMLYSSPALCVNGEVHIPQNVNNIAWENLFSALEVRMQNGEFTVIDATNSKTVEMNKYKKLADEYRYRIYLIDMTNVPIDEVKRRNKLRLEWKWVPEDCIDNMYARFKTQKVPSQIKVITEDELELLKRRPIEISDQYKEVVHIGDIHGCYETLMSALPKGIEEDKFYVFLGDYYERGPEDIKTLDFMESIADLPNVVLLEGNHETHLWNYAVGNDVKSKHFMGYTVPNLIEGGWDAKRMRIFCKKLHQCYYYTFNGQKVLCTHGGISNSDFDNMFPLGLTCVATYDLIHGVGSYNDTAESDRNFAKGDIYQIHGHRNIEDADIKGIANLEGGVEWGKELREARLDRGGLSIIHIPYCDRIPSSEEFFGIKQDVTVKQFIETLRKNKYINEKNVKGNISSFNFTRGAFSRSHRDRETVKARGLFININTYKIVARAYNKFFNIDEQKCTMLFSIGQNAQFPIVGYKKYNGYLGIIGYDEESNELIFTSKSEVGGPHAIWLREIVEEKGIDLGKVKEYLKENLCSLVFEVIDPINDPHIIKYNNRDVVLLDCVKNIINFEKLPYEELLELGDKLGFMVKEIVTIVKDMTELRECLNKLADINSEYNTGVPIEGIVFVDKDDFMFKQKGEYYLQWKKLRALIGIVARSGNFVHTGMLTTPEMNEFFGWLKQQTLTGEENIIELRDRFYLDKNK